MSKREISQRVSYLMLIVDTALIGGNLYLGYVNDSLWSYACGAFLFAAMMFLVFVLWITRGGPR